MASFGRAAIGATTVGATTDVTTSPLRRAARAYAGPEEFIRDILDHFISKSGSGGVSGASRKLNPIVA